MFGKPIWFKEKRFSWGITPVCRQGWYYTALWVAVLVLPFLLLISQHLIVESLVWLAVAMGVLVWDVRQILAAMRPADENVLYIGDTDSPSDQIATRNFEFRLRG